MNQHSEKSLQHEAKSVANSADLQRSGKDKTVIPGPPDPMRGASGGEGAVRVKQLKAFQEMANNSPQARLAAQWQTMADNAVTRQRKAAVVQRSNGPGKEKESMDKDLSAEKETVPKESAVNALLSLSLNPEKDEEEGPEAVEEGSKEKVESKEKKGEGKEKEEVGSGIIGANMGAYLIQIKKLEALYLAEIEAEKLREEEGMRKLKAKGATLEEVMFYTPHPAGYFEKKCDRFIIAVYEACRDILLPNLGAYFPKLKIIAKWGDDEASFGSRTWDIEIQRPEGFKLQKLDALFQLSSTFLHETRHAEQDWIRLIKNDPNMSKLDKPKGLTKLVNKTTKKLPKDMDLDYMKDIFSVTPDNWSKFFKLLALHKKLGSKARSASEEALYSKLHEQYKAFPAEADAYAMEARYKELYETYKL